jgi:D-sedoheptulose 7-phosphate isomerase
MNVEHDDAALVAAGLREAAAVIERLATPGQVAEIVEAAQAITASLRTGGKLLVFGNGGSAADAQHIAAEFLGRFLLERQALPAIALGDNTSTLTAVGNDYAFEDVFARQVAGLGAPGDVALAISTSGNSPNVLAAIAVARERGLRTIGLAGGDGGRLAEEAELCLVVPAPGTPRVQEAQMVIAHLLCQLVEQHLAAGVVVAATAR